MSQLSQFSIIAIPFIFGLLGIYLVLKSTRSGGRIDIRRIRQLEDWNNELKHRNEFLESKFLDLHKRHNDLIQLHLELKNPDTIEQQKSSE